MIRVNNKKRRQSMEQKPVDAPQQQEQVARRFVPNDCTMCREVRPKGKTYSYVYWSGRNVRYCKCGFCGHTWKQGRDHESN